MLPTRVGTKLTFEARQSRFAFGGRADTAELGGTKAAFEQTGHGAEAPNLGVALQNGSDCSREGLVRGQYLGRS